jgi:hypothetical protein
MAHAPVIVSRFSSNLLASQRLHLEEGDASILRKLHMCDSFYADRRARDHASRLLRLIQIVI